MRINNETAGYTLVRQWWTKLEREAEFFSNGGVFPVDQKCCSCWRILLFSVLFFFSVRGNKKSERVISLAAARGAYGLNFCRKIWSNVPARVSILYFRFLFAFVHFLSLVNISQKMGFMEIIFANNTTVGIWDFSFPHDFDIHWHFWRCRWEQSDDYKNLIQWQNYLLKAFFLLDIRNQWMNIQESSIIESAFELYSTTLFRCSIIAVKDWMCKRWLTMEIIWTDSFFFFEEKYCN